MSAVAKHDKGEHCACRGRARLKTKAPFLRFEGRGGGLVLCPTNVSTSAESTEILICMSAPGRDKCAAQ